jgi:TrmH family RNA methyltransferase
LKASRERAATGRFLIEGEREVARALECGVDIEFLLECPELLERSVVEVTPPVERIELAEAAMGKVAMRQHPPGLIAVARQFDTSLDAIRLGRDPLVLIAEAVEKPGNLGAMLRTADAFGIDAVVMVDSGTDIFNPNVVRASQGALFSVDVAAATAAAAIAWAISRGLQIVGGYPDASRDVWDVDVRGPTAMLVGAEDAGISNVWEEVANPVRIPMEGISDSLNASVAAALMLYEAVRQRRIG